MYKVKVAGQIFSYKPIGTSVAQSVNTEFVEFVFDEAWDGLHRYACFKNNRVEQEYHILLNDTNMCAVPWEVLAVPGQLYIGALGTAKDGTVVQPTIWVQVSKVVEGVSPEGDISQEATPAAILQVTALAGQAVDIAKTVQMQTQGVKHLGDGSTVISNALQVKPSGDISLAGIPFTPEHLMYMLTLGSVISGRKIDLGQRNTITSDKAYNYFSIGWDNIITGRGSFSAGYMNEDAGEVNFTFGTGNKLKSSHRNAAVFGRYNDPDVDFLFAVGGGTSEDDRKNALTVTEQGIEVPSYIAIGNTILSEETLNRLIEKLWD